MFKKSLLVVLMVLAGPGVSLGFEDIFERQTLTNGLFGLNNQLEDKGIEASFSLLQIYQRNVRGGLSTDTRTGEYSGSYDLEVTADLEKLIGLKGGLYICGEGGWTDAGGIDAASVGSIFGVNADAIGNRSMDVKEFYCFGQLFDMPLEVMVGKIDFTGVFDSSNFADDEVTQFLNASFVDNPTIPFPQYSLGIVLNYNINGRWYVMGGIADAEADGRETGFNTTFAGKDYFFTAFEMGYNGGLDSSRGTLEGNYRAGLWYDPQPKSNTASSQTSRDDLGLYLSFDQMLVKENADANDTQGLGGFFRYGYADGRRNDVQNFFSFGVQYQGLIEGRDDDVLGAGLSHGTFTDLANSVYSDDYESVVEVYYNAQIAPWLQISPNVQYISNPGGVNTSKNSLILGLRALILL